MTIRTTLIATTLVTAGLVSGAAHAELQARNLSGYYPTVIQAYYDTDLNVTWLVGSSFGITSNSVVSWNDANIFASMFSTTHIVNQDVYDNWRLPNIGQLDHLYFEDVGTTLRTLNYSGYDWYWSATEYNTDSMWAFHISYSYDESGSNLMVSGSNVEYSKLEYATTLLVSSGDVGVAVVPEANTWAMLLAGLGLVGAATRRRRG